MATRLRSIRLVQTSHMSVQIDSEAFYRGYTQGMTNQDKRFDLFSDPSEASILAIVTNLCEMAADSELSEAQLRHDCGLIAGHLLRHEIR
jgi:hypothetical protein